MQGWFDDNSSTWLAKFRTRQMQDVLLDNALLQDTTAPDCDAGIGLMTQQARG
jgi:hypothetical protein